MGMSEREFGEMHLGTFFLKLHYFFKAIEIKRKEAAELIRTQTLYLINIQLTPSDRLKDPRSFWPLPWDEASTDLTVVNSAEEQAERIQKLIKLHEKAHG